MAKKGETPLSQRNELDMAGSAPDNRPTKDWNRLWPNRVHESNWLKAALCDERAMLLGS